MANLNVVCLSGNLTKDPELRSLPSGTSVCNMRIAVNDRYKDRDGNWVERPFYFNVTAWGAHGEACGKYLQRGSGVIVNGKLTWREWDAEDGTKRQSVDINASDVIFMPRGDGGGQRSGGGGARSGSDLGAPMPATAPQDDDDIPFAYLDVFDPSAL